MVISVVLLALIGAREEIAIVKWMCTGAHFGSVKLK